MRQSDDEPPRNKRSSYTEQTNEAPKLLEDEPAEVERELPAGDNSSVERTEPHDRPASPLFED
ncbi:MAG: hypothetical protein WB420_15580 [Bradyrhizobium sp.]|jgi:hypothetical protein